MKEPRSAKLLRSRHRFAEREIYAEAILGFGTGRRSQGVISCSVFIRRKYSSTLVVGASDNARSKINKQ
jgi:hypothetical protein